MRHFEHFWKLKKMVGKQSWKSSMAFRLGYVFVVIKRLWILWPEFLKRKHWVRGVVLDRRAASRALRPPKKMRQTRFFSDLAPRCLLFLPFLTCPTTKFGLEWHRSERWACPNPHPPYQDMQNIDVSCTFFPSTWNNENTKVSTWRPSW